MLLWGHILLLKFKMSFIKQILTTENFSISDFKISTFILFAILIIVILIIVLKLKRQPIMKNLIKVTFLSLSIITFLFALLNALTGEFLFSQENNFRLYMLIATVALWIYIGDSLKDLLQEHR